MRKVHYSVQLPVTVLREHKRYVAYTPALDLSTSGRTFKEAKRRFEQVVEIFFEEVTARGTIDATLAELGWHKAQQQWRAPVIVGQESEIVRVPMT